MIVPSPILMVKFEKKMMSQAFLVKIEKVSKKMLLTFLYFISNEMMILLDQVPEKMKIWERRVNWIDFYLIHFKIRQTEKHKKILFKSMTIFPALFQTIFLIFFLFSQAICTVNSKL